MERARQDEIDQSVVDARAQDYYSGRSGWDEHARLTSRSAQGPLERGCRT